MLTRALHARLIAPLAVVLASLAPGAPASSAPCVPQQVPGVGLACPVEGGYRIPLAGGGWVFTHGPDPAPSGHTIPDAFADRVPPVCVSDRMIELHGLVVYAHASDREDMSAQKRAQLVEMVERANGMLRREAARYGRTLDYRMACTSDGTVLVERVMLPTPLSTTTFESVVNDMRLNGYADPLAKYWIWFDGHPPDSGGGFGTIQDDDRAGPDNANNFGPSYGVTWGFTGTGGAKIMMHENAHNLGAVQMRTPNASGGWHCNDGLDVMCYADGGPTSQYRTTACTVIRFDCRGDDYFNLDPIPGTYIAERWNLASPFNRAVEGCLFATGLLGAPGPDPVSSASIAIPEDCRGGWFGASASIPAPPASLGPTWSNWMNTSPLLPTVDVCWYADASLLRCDDQVKAPSGRVPATATSATVTVRLGAASVFVLSIV